LKYQQPSFTLATTTKRMSQTDWEIAMGLRNLDGTLKRPKRPKKKK